MDNFGTEVTHTTNHSLCPLFKPLHVQEKLTLNSQEISRVGSCLKHLVPDFLRLHSSLRV